ncbi:hypothetical protein PGT21_008957 [Puccinia graminis f. sp. tritici]|uniref:Uncharacterized protein n=1 Tax=Puccinia graminis f. sp. tritici TaxID=56615 RepID=A0A5B0NIM9_PUCGR|nr:hypothetical protein PGT21_008957 [Puccinia graminis f. sp. tritici]
MSHVADKTRFYPTNSTRFGILENGSLGAFSGAVLRRLRVISRSTSFNKVREATTQGISRLVAPNKPSEGDILTKSHPATSGRDHRPLTHVNAITIVSDKRAQLHVYQNVDIAIAETRLQQLPFLNRSHWDNQEIHDSSYRTRLQVYKALSLGDGHLTIFKLFTKLSCTSNQPCHFHGAVEAHGGDVDPAFLSAGTVDRNFEVENHQNFEVADQSFEVQAPHQNSDLLAVACTSAEQIPEYPRREVDWDKFQVITYSPKTLSFVTADMMKYHGRKLFPKDNVKDLEAVGARCSRSRPERIGELVVLQPALAEFFRLGTEISAGTTYVSRLTPVNV